jgi:uncharacterized repeat protein (TIGR03803 family)
MMNTTHDGSPAGTRQLLRHWRVAATIFAGALVLTPPAFADSFAVLHTFDSADGSIPQAGLVQGIDGRFYGTTARGGANDWGTVFAIGSTGAFELLHSFDNLDGQTIRAGLTLFDDGNFYGSTPLALEPGSRYGYVGGTNFQITASGNLLTLHKFTYRGLIGGTMPGDLVGGGDGYLYGTTSGNGVGTVFKLGTNGTFSTEYAFRAGLTPGAGLTRGNDGTLYGTLARARSCCSSSIFGMTLAGVVTILHEFEPAEGGDISWNMAEAPAGTLYGTTSISGPSGNGTAFRMTADGNVTVLHAFDQNTGAPTNGLVLGPDGNFYGATKGPSGTVVLSQIYRMTAAGELTVLHELASGAGAVNKLVFGSDGWLYGTTTGQGGGGTVFKFDAVSEHPLPRTSGM